MKVRRKRLVMLKLGFTIFLTSCNALKPVSLSNSSSSNKPVCANETDATTLPPQKKSKRLAASLSGLVKSEKKNKAKAKTDSTEPATANVEVSGPIVKKRKISTDELVFGYDGPVSGTRYQMCAYGQEYLGTPYRSAGRSGNGFDCSGFTSYIMSNFGVSLSAASSTQATQGTEIPIESTKPGDLLFFGKRGRITHVAMVVSNTPKGLEVVHSTSSRGVVVENVTTSAYWNKKILFARDVVGDL